jgi:ribosomal protein L16 Arg81 hydroxylase
VLLSSVEIRNAPWPLRQAIPGFKPLIPRARLLAMAGEDGVESRLIQQLDGGAWKLSHGPLSRRSLPSLQKPGWTVLAGFSEWFGGDTPQQTLNAFRATFVCMGAVTLASTMIFSQLGDDEDVRPKPLEPAEHE